MWAWCWVGIWSQRPRRRLKWWLVFLPLFLTSSLGNMWTKWTSEVSWVWWDAAAQVLGLAGVTARSLSINLEQFWWLHQSSREARGPSSLLGTGEDTSGVLGAVLGYPGQGRHECSGVSPVKAVEMMEWSLTNEGRLRELWLFILELEDIQGRRVQRRTTRSSLMVSSDWMRRNGHNLKFKCKGKQNLFLCVQWGWWNTGADFPQPLGAAIYGDVRFLTGRGPGQPAQADPSRGLDPVVSSSPCQPPPAVVLWPRSSLDCSLSIASLLFFLKALSFGASGHIMSISQERWWEVWSNFLFVPYVFNGI